MKEYIELLKDLRANGSLRNNRTEVPAYSLFSRSLRFNLQDGFPVLTTKRLSFKSIIVELLWFLSGSTNIKYLHDHGVSIWDEWADSDGNLGPIYGKQWRSWDGVDQVSNLIDTLRNNPNSRRMLLTALNIGSFPDESISPKDNVKVGKMALAPCHVLTQFYVKDYKLSSMFYMRSTDVFLGLPYNIASYALLTHILAKHLNMDVGELVYIGGDIHLYENHIEQADLQISRIPYSRPKLIFRKERDNIFEHEWDDFVLCDYKFHPSIKAPIAV